MVARTFYIPHMYSSDVWTWASYPALLPRQAWRREMVASTANLMCYVDKVR